MDDITWAEWVLCDPQRQSDLRQTMYRLGDFMFFLARALNYADLANSLRILTTWQDKLELHFPMVLEPV